MLRTIAAALLGLALLSGCASSSDRYVRDNIDSRVVYAGRIQTITHAVITDFDQLSDGAACIVENPDCKVTLDIAGKTEVLALRPKDFFVLAKRADWVVVTRDEAPR